MSVRHIRAAVNTSRSQIVNSTDITVQQSGGNYFFREASAPIGGIDTDAVVAVGAG